MRRRFILIFAASLLLALLGAASAQATITSYYYVQQTNGSTIAVEFDYHSYDYAQWEAEQYRARKLVSGSVTTFFMERVQPDVGTKVICGIHTVTSSSWHRHTGHAEFYKNMTYHEAAWGSWPEQRFWVDL